MAKSDSPTPITLAEEAAQRSRRGYDYQDLIAASWCLEMLRDPSLQKVACETQDDVVLTWTGSDGAAVAEFVQVKSDRLKQQWSVANFCDQRTASVEDGGAKKKRTARYRRDTSIFEKNALRDQGRHSARFRIVTRADVSELRVLTEPLDKRAAADSAGLATALESALKNNSSLDAGDIQYWVAHAFWDVRGTDSAVFEANFRKLADAVQTLEQRLLAVVDLERILHHLAQATRAMAMGQGTCGANPSAVTREELQAWLAAEVRAIPHFLAAAETDALLREERHSLARCKALWLALGVPEGEAGALARQPEIGARQEFFEPFASGFHWVTASYGAGKSLAVERLFQRQLADYAAQRDARVPVFLRAYGIVGSLQDAVLARLRDLRRDAGSPPLFVIVDAVDEAGTSRAQRLLQEACELSATWPGSTFIATSTNLPVSFDQFRRRLPGLPDERAAEVVSVFAQHQVQSWSVRERLGNDSGLALLCVLLGLALRESDAAAPSRGELLHRVVETARKRSGEDATRWAEQSDRLCRIAMLSTDSGGGPVRFTELGMVSTELTPLYTTRLIAEEAGNIVFTVATMRLWFAAQALRKGWVNAADLARDLPRARHWQEPLAIFAATTDFASASRYLEPLAATYPAVAAKVIADATSRWGEGSGRAPAEFAAFAQRVRRCLEAWLRGIEPLAQVCDFTDRQGRLLKVRAGFKPPHTVIAFSHDPSLPPASALPPGWTHEDVEQHHGYMEADEPVHLWRQTYEMVRADLRKAVECTHWERVDAALLHEDVWHQAAGFSQVSPWFARSMPWEVIDRFQQVFRRPGVWDWIGELRTAHPDAFPAPHPPADNTDRTESWIPNFFSPPAALARAQSTYAMAFDAYQRIVSKYFPHFSNDLRHSAWWPCRLVGTVGSAPEGPALRDWWITYHCEPVSSEAEARVTLRLGTQEEYAARADLDTVRESVVRLRPNASPWYWGQSAALNFYDSHPASVLVKTWLLDDLASAGWGH